MLGLGGDLVVSRFNFFSNGPSSNTAYFYCLKLNEWNQNQRKLVPGMAHLDSAANQALIGEVKVLEARIWPTQFEIVCWANFHLRKQSNCPFKSTSTLLLYDVFCTCFDDAEKAFQAGTQICSITTEQGMMAFIQCYIATIDVAD